MRSIFKPWYVWRPEQILRRMRLPIRAGADRWQLVTTSWGGQLIVDAHASIGQAIYVTGIFDLAVSELLVRLTSPGARVVDIGGNIGYMALLLACRASPGGHLSAFEPHPELFRQMQENLRRNWPSLSLNGLELHRCALGTRGGKCLLMIPSGFSLNNGIAYLDESGEQERDGSIKVDVTTLDQSFPKEQIEVMKMDVEGHEAAVLSGGRRLFSERRVRHLVFEALDGVEGLASQQLRSWGYHILRIGWSFWKPILATLDQAPVHRDYEAPSFLATIDKDDALKRCGPMGWRCLRSIKSLTRGD